MRILIPVFNDVLFNSKDSPYVRSISNGLTALGNIVDVDVNKFYFADLPYDIIDIQWPDALLPFTSITNDDIIKLKNQINFIKEKGIKIVATVHNLHPHNNNKWVDMAYRIVYDNADAFHHLGKYSFELFSKKYPNRLNFITAHPIYYDIVGMGLNKQECRERLHLDKNKITILSFGAFRKESERDLFYKMAKSLGHKDIQYVAPRFLCGRLYNGRNLPYTYAYLKRIFKLKYAHILSSGENVEEAEIPYYLTAADIVFIQRKEILNSGNVPLAFSAGKIVVGPDMGNVGCLLKGTNNFTFNPENTESVVNAIKNAIHEYLSNNNSLGKLNYEYARKHGDINEICEIINDNYSKLIL